MQIYKYENMFLIKFFLVQNFGYYLVLFLKLQRMVYLGCCRILTRKLFMIKKQFLIGSHFEIY